MAVMTTMIMSQLTAKNYFRAPAVVAALTCYRSSQTPRLTIKAKTKCPGTNVCLSGITD